MEYVSVVHVCVGVGRDEESERLGGIYMCGEVKSEVNKVKINKVKYVIKEKIRTVSRMQNKPKISLL